jgi:hypothetical protein
MMLFHLQGGYTARPDSPQHDHMGSSHQRKGSILRAASALAGGIEEREDITFVPLKVWTKQPTTQELLCEKENKRQRYGWEVDFSDFKMPFLKNVANRVEEFGGFDDEDD